MAELQAALARAEQSEAAWRLKHYSLEARLVRFRQEAAEISKAAIRRAAEMEIRVEKAKILEEEENSRFSRIKAELDDLRR